jgi:hypothetical protein
MKPKPIDQSTTEELLRAALNNPEKRAVFIAKAFVRECRNELRQAFSQELKRECSNALRALLPMLRDPRLKKPRGRPRKRKDRVFSFSGDDPSLECLGAMEYLNRTTGEKKAQTLARAALDDLLEGGIVTLGNRSYWTVVERLARLWKEKRRIENKKKKTEK